MKSRIAMIAALVATCGFAGIAWTGCSSDDGGTPTGPGPTGASCELKDLESPPINCGPTDEGAEACSKTTNVEACPKNECMSQVDQSGTTRNYRMGRIRLWAPDALLALTPIAVDPNVNAKCANAGSESFTWLMQVDTAAKTLRTGGARAAADSKTFAFLDESVNAASLEAICPGFKGPSEPVSLKYVDTTITLEGDKFSTPKIDLINVPIFDSSGLPIILPLREAFLKDVQMNGSCIGKWDSKYWCDGAMRVCTTGGAIIAKITAEDADKVPVKSAGCQSLCAILVNDATKTDGKVCKRGADGKIPEIGTHCAGGAGCKNAFLLSATFGAYGVTITGAAPGPVDAGGETGGTDAGGSETGGETGGDGG